MSFILDALRKSESERQMETSPNMMRVPLSVPSAHLPAWALIVMIALAVALLGSAAAWWTTAQRSSSALPGIVGAGPQTEALIEPRPAAGAGTHVETAVRDAAPARTPSARRASGTDLQNAPIQAGPGRISASEASPAEPAAAPANVAAPPPAAEPFSSLPSVAQIVAEGLSVPSLELQLLVNSEARGSRFVLINGARYTEGDRLVEGPQVIAIIAEGAVLEHHGRRFLLAPN